MDEKIERRIITMPKFKKFLFSFELSSIITKHIPSVNKLEQNA